MISISVITCAHNPRPDYLQQVIAALERQTLSKDRWEYLLIDNASTEPLAARIDLKWHPQARHIREETLGLTPARLCGIREAAGELLVFVDDDNVLDNDYLERVAALAEAWPILGAFGGQVRPRFAEPPPDWTRQYWSRLVIREFNDDRWSNIPGLHETMPSGAGLCVRRQVANEYAAYHENGKRKVMMDRTGASLLSGGDTDLASTACDIGLGAGLFVTLKLTHLIPPERLTEDYLARLLEGLAFSGVVVGSFRANGTATPAPGWKTAAADQLRERLMGPRERRFFRAVRKGERDAARFLQDRKREPKG
jgi:glycosyltransferase involved in cell wall biosynthesis